MRKSISPTVAVLAIVVILAVGAVLFVKLFYKPPVNAGSVMKQKMAHQGKAAEKSKGKGPGAGSGGLRRRGGGR